MLTPDEVVEATEDVVDVVGDARGVDAATVEVAVVVVWSSPKPNKGDRLRIMRPWWRAWAR